MAEGLFDEEKVAELLNEVLLTDNDEEEEVEGLEDVIPYIAGVVTTQFEEELGSDSTNGPEAAALTDILDDSMVPFLESSGVSSIKIEKAKAAILEGFTIHTRTGSNGSTSTATTTATTTTTTTQRLSKDRVVNMSSALDTDLNFDEHVENESMWASSVKGKVVKANANTVMSTEASTTSAKEKRKAKQDVIKLRKEYAEQMERDEMNNTQKLTETKSGVSQMILPTSKGKDMDVILLNITLHLENGTCLLEKGDLKFAYQRRYAIIGENGVGKTTLLNKIANWEQFDGFPQHLRVLHVKQEMNTEQEETCVLDAVLEADVERTQLLHREQELTHKLEAIVPPAPETSAIATITTAAAGLPAIAAVDTTAAFAAQGDDLEFAHDMQELKEVYDRLQLLGADTAQSRASAILTGLQFTDDMQHAPIKSLSGGWRMRVALAASLLIEPDILMLDEPTNHLDLEAVLWLEAHLQQYPHTIIAVSHDRGFLNEVCTDTIHFTNQKQLVYYKGNYDTFVKLKREKTKNAIREYNAYKTKRDHMMEFIIKFRANAKRATMVQSRVKTVDKMDLEAPPQVEEEAVWRFTIPSSDPLGRPIIAINDATFDYNSDIVLDDGTKKPVSEYLLQKINFGVDNASKIAILGANGQGKTTLLNLIMGTIRPSSGSVAVKSGLRIGHFTQHHSERFDLKLSAIENMLNIFSTDTTTEDDQVVRSFLGKFQIQGNDAIKPMRFLSGGQKSRVSFAVLAYQKPHLLIIDEGSNHLSMDAVDALIEAVKQFKGGLIVVSHDQYFVSQTCNELWIVENGQATRFEGTFDDYKVHTAKKTAKHVEVTVKKLSNLNN